MSIRSTPRVNEARETLIAGDPGHLTDEHLLSVLMGENAASAVLGGLEHRRVPLGDLPVLGADDLIAIDGVGRASAARLLACLEIGRRFGARPVRRRTSVSTPEDVVRVCGSRMIGLDREHFLALALNTKNGLIRIIEVSVGSLNASIVHPRELFKDAVRSSAASVIVVHNHPSGDPTPSGADIQLTRRLVKAGDVLGIEVLDHVVIGDVDEYASLREMGLM